MERNKASKEEIFLLFDSIKRLSSIIKHTLGIELILCFYICYILLNQQVNTTISLPIFQIEMPSSQFLVFAPISFLLLHYYLHMHLAEIRTKLKFIFATNFESITISRELFISSWLFTFTLEKRFIDNTLPRLVQNHIFIISINFLFNFLVPITIFYIWYNFIDQQLFLSFIPAISFILSLYSSLYSNKYENTFPITLSYYLISFFIVIFTLSSVPSLRSLLLLDSTWKFILQFQSNYENYTIIILLPMAFFAIAGLILDGLFYEPFSEKNKSYKKRRARRIAFILYLQKVNSKEDFTIRKVFFNGVYTFAIISGHGLQIGYGISVFIGFCLLLISSTLYFILYIINT